MRLLWVGLGSLLACVAKSRQQPLRIDTDLTVGWSNWGLSGNQNKFRQYATAPRGFFAKELRIGLTDDIRNDARFVLKGPGEDDYRLTGLVRLNGWTTRVMATDFRNDFFDPDRVVTNGSQRRVSEGYIWQKIRQDFAISLRSRMDNQDEHLSDPFQVLSQSTRTSSAVARGSLWRNGFVDLSYVDSRYDDRTGVLPNTTTQSMSAGLVQQIGDSLALSGSYVRTLVRQPGAATDKVDEWNFGGNLLWGDSTNILLNYRNERIEMPTVQDAYDRSRQEIRARMVRRLGSGWNLQLGYDQLALERANTDHTFVDVPRLHTFDTQFGGPLSRSARLTGTISRQVMEGSAGMETADPRAQYWTSRWDAQVKLNAHNELANAYLVFDWHQNRNSQRDVTVRHQGLTVGAEWDLKPELDCYAEISTNLWSGHTSDPLSPDIDSFFPDDVNLTLGANWTVNAKTWVTANYTFYNNKNTNTLNLPDTSFWGSFFTGSVHYKVSKNAEFGLTIAPWQFSDLNANPMSYGTGLVQVTAKMRF